MSEDCENHAEAYDWCGVVLGDETAALIKRDACEVKRRLSAIIGYAAIASFAVGGFAGILVSFIVSKLH